jgi:hypothetical protein
MVAEDKDNQADMSITRTEDWNALRELEDAVAPIDKVEALLATLAGSAAQIYDDSGLNNVNLLRQSIDVAVHQLHALVNEVVEKLDVLFTLHRKRYNLPQLTAKDVNDMSAALKLQIQNAFQTAKQQVKVAKIEAVLSKPSKKKAAKKVAKKAAKRTTKRAGKW